MILSASPVYIFGDIHGNFRDLMIYDHLFWKTAPKGIAANCLFLGDYVDRGDYSVECLLYLLCMKNLMPNKIHLIRGNHEDRSVQKMYTFQRECVSKFGAQQGATLWELFNEVLDCMPLCAIVDEQVFTAHGGIPSCVSRVEELYNIAPDLPQPNLMSKPAWEMLWNDPLNMNDYKNAVAGLLDLTFPQLPQGCFPNNKRGTAYFYTGKNSVAHQ